MRVRQDVGHEDRLTQKNRRAAGSDLGTDTHTVGGDSIGVRQLWARSVSKPQSVLIEQENRAQYSFRMGFDEQSDTVENVVERRVGENHFEGIEHTLTGQSLRSRRGCCERLIQDND